MAHGSGGRAMRDLIDDVFLSAFGSGPIVEQDDQARLQLAELLRAGDRLAFTTDSFVIDPIFFPGGDLGTVAINGTINDLAVGGATPVALSAAMIVEAGLPVDDLRRIAASMAETARFAGVPIVTGDTKVVDRGAADKLFITTTGIGVILAGRELGPQRIQAGDAILVNDTIGNHSAAVMAARGDLKLATTLRSDCRSLHRLVEALLDVAPNTRAIRDATRGGVATVLVEFAQSSGLGLRIEEERLPVSEPVRGMAEILGLDPLYLANEGVFVAVVPAEEADAVPSRLASLAGGAAAAIIGEVTSDHSGEVVMTSLFGGERLIDMLDGDQLPRIC